MMGNGDVISFHAWVPGPNDNCFKKLRNSAENDLCYRKLCCYLPCPRDVFHIAVGPRNNANKIFSLH